MVSISSNHTDGCAKQYISGNALFLLNIVAMTYNITIDRVVCAPGHGKSIIDAMNAVDKNYLVRLWVFQELQDVTMSRHEFPCL